MFYTINFLKISSTFIICVGHSFLHLLRLFSFFLNTLTFFKITGYLVCRMSPQFGFTWFLPEKIQVIHFWQEYHTWPCALFSVSIKRCKTSVCLLTGDATLMTWLRQCALAAPAISPGFHLCLSVLCSIHFFRSTVPFTISFFKCAYFVLVTLGIVFLIFIIIFPLFLFQNVLINSDSLLFLCHSLTFSFNIFILYFISVNSNVWFGLLHGILFSCCFMIWGNRGNVGSCWGGTLSVIIFVRWVFKCLPLRRLCICFCQEPGSTANTGPLKWNFFLVLLPGVTLVV